jgi:hypothetical protein
LELKRPDKGFMMFGGSGLADTGFGKRNTRTQNSRTQEFKNSGIRGLKHLLGAGKDAVEKDEKMAWATSYPSIRNR